MTMMQRTLIAYSMGVITPFGIVLAKRPSIRTSEKPQPLPTKSPCQEWNRPDVKFSKMEERRIGGFTIPPSARMPYEIQ